MGPIRSIPLEKLPPGYQTKPQNGRIAWLHAITGLLIVFNCWGINNAFGLFQEYYETVHLPGSSPSTIAWIGSTQLALVFALGVPVGKLVDKGHFRLVFHTGTVIMLVGIFCTAWCTKFWQLFLVQGLITGLGMGMVFCSGVVALMTWFDEMHVGMAMGVAAAGSAIGGIAYVLLARHLLRTMGFATTMRILGGVAAVAMVPPSLVYRMRDQKHKHLRRFQRASRASPIQFGSFESSAMMPMPVTMPPRTGWRTFVQPEYLLAGAGMSLAFLGVYFPFVFIISYGSTELDLSQKASTNLLIYMLSASLPGRFVPALISDRCIGPLNTVIPSVLLSSAVIGLWAASQQNEVSLIVLACFYGFVSAGVQVLYAPTVHALCMEPKPTRAPFDELNSHMNHGLATDRLGLKAGGIFIFIGIACLVGTPIGGALIRYSTDMGISQPFLAGQIFAAVSLLLSGVLLLASRTAKAGWTARRT
ncbi:MFS transporter [Lecanosticta acicola]|uniref:MFS transporter n=1 Tax=Lecanosticta acicola TaxID=111012 RepID=A0AAI8YR94_9PEZI|nr:MFS transporter [Lecanosticta acicola]